MVSDTSYVSRGTEIQVAHGSRGVFDEQLATVEENCDRLSVPVSAGQETHARDAEEFEYVPAPHSEQRTEPVPSSKVPGRHSSHAPDPDDALK
eukprot:2218282-Rhodomonas_salina.1